MAAFLLGVAATSIGAVVAGLAFSNAFPGDAWRLAGVMPGPYSGGSLNVVSVGRAVGLSETLFAAAAAADNLLTGVWMGATLVLPIWLRRVYPPRKHADSDATVNSLAKSLLASPLRIFDVLVLLALGFSS